MRTDEPADTAAILSDLARAKALFQARTIAAVIGAAPPSPATFASDHTAREDRP